MPLNFEELVGEESFLFYGAENGHFKLDEVVWEAREDENDGYRSMLDCVVAIRGAQKHIFFREPLAIVTIRRAEESIHEGYELIDEEDHIWLRFGTDRSDDYYPMYYFNYSPKAKVTITTKPKIVNNIYEDFDDLFNPREY